jgi:hypothetical protein
VPSAISCLPAGLNLNAWCSDTSAGGMRGEGQTVME